MAGKKFAPRRLKSPKRDIGVNPLAVAGGAAAGAAAGAKIAARKTTRNIMRTMIQTPKYAPDDAAYESKRKYDGWGAISSNTRNYDRVSTAASRVGDKYGKGSRDKALGRARTELSSQKANMNTQRSSARSVIRETNRVARGRSARRGAIGGALTGAAISAIAQAVAREMRRRG